jgi:C4-type Zn-finger protein
LELELDEGGLDGVYTTVEGLLEKLHDRLTKANPFGSGDSATKQHTSVSHCVNIFTQTWNASNYLPFL